MGHEIHLERVWAERHGSHIGISRVFFFLFFLRGGICFLFYLDWVWRSICDAFYVILTLLIIRISSFPCVRWIATYAYCGRADSGPRVD